MRLQPLRFANDIPQIGIAVHDIADDSYFARQAIHGRFSSPRPPSRGTDDGYGETSLGDGDGIAPLLDLVEQGEALGFELGGANGSGCHGFILAKPHSSKVVR
jgi:hypothetical protein